ncbi:hypothetical protein ADK64_32750 [Streptomyces sp. MMG1121]|nr:hypothetical protein ADK64_32750 [Streptomyces sp. MMG1121]
MATRGRSRACPRRGVRALRAALPGGAFQRLPAVDLYPRKSGYASSCPYRHGRYPYGRPCAAQPGDHP